MLLCKSVSNDLTVWRNQVFKGHVMWQGMMLPLLLASLQTVFKHEYNVYRFYSNLQNLVLLKIINK